MSMASTLFLSTGRGVLLQPRRARPPRAPRSKSSSGGSSLCDLSAPARQSFLFNCISGFLLPSRISV